MDFQGTYEHTLDAKNRLTIPADHRHRFEGGVVLAQGIEPCVSIWVPQAYDDFVAETLVGRDRLAPETRKLARYFSGRSVRTALDSANRVLLTPMLITHAGLRHEITVCAALDCLEIWDRAEYETMSAELDAEFPDMTALLGRQG